MEDDTRAVPYLTATTGEGHRQTTMDQMHLLHKEFAHPLPVGIIAKPNLRPQARARVVLCSRDLALACALRVDSDGLRCHSEFHCRAAKPSWGLEDCMTVTPTGVTNAANLSGFMVNVAYHRRTDRRPRDPDSSVLDLKADCRGYTDVEETIKRLPQKPAPVLWGQILNQVACLGRIHAAQPAFSFSSLAQVLRSSRKYRRGESTITPTIATNIATTFTPTVWQTFSVSEHLACRPDP